MLCNITQTHFQLVLANSVAISIIGDDIEEKLRYFEKHNNLSPEKEPIAEIATRVVNWFSNTGCQVYIYPYMKEKGIRRKYTNLMLWLSKKSNAFPEDVVLKKPGMPINKMCIK